MDSLGTVWSGQQGGKPMKLFAFVIFVICVVMIGVTAGLYSDMPD